MDEISRRRGFCGLSAPRNDPSLVVRDIAGSRDQDSQFCNRLGCSGRLKAMKSVQNGCQLKGKMVKTSYRCSTSGKEMVGSSSRTCSVVSKSRRSSFLSPRNKGPCQMETDSSETSSVQNEPDDLDPAVPSGKIKTGRLPKLEGVESDDVAFTEVGSSSIASNTRPCKNIHQKLKLIKQERPTVSSVSRVPRSTGPGGSSGGTGSGLGSVSDSIPPDCSSQESNCNRRKVMVKKRSPEGESSSSIRGKKTVGPSILEEKRNPSNGHGISISDSRRSRSCLSNIGSVRTRNENSRAQLSNQRNRTNLSSIETPAGFQRRIVGRVNVPSLSQRLSIGSPSHANSCNLPGSSSDNIRNIVATGTAEVPFTNPSMNRDGIRHYNVDGIAEVLLALERIEQDEEITFEQLLMLETNLLLNGLATHDQHRDMRLDIDNMSYEELLDLEDRMGTVSTALSEEEMPKCLRSSIYHPTSFKTQVMGCRGDHDDVKCSICQEEYLDGDDVGMLRCEHRYHSVCVQQWLRLKNWCPICKASVAPASSFLA